MRDADSEEGNFDALQESPAKFPILRPILKSGDFKSLHILSQKHITPLVSDAILSLLPPMTLKRADGEARNIEK